MRGEGRVITEDRAKVWSNNMYKRPMDKDNGCGGLNVGGKSGYIRGTMLKEILEQL